jgi:hypothetical protein
MYMFEPKLLTERKFMVELTAGRELAWKENREKELLSTDDLAHCIAIAFFDLVSQANRGKVEMRFL